MIAKLEIIHNALHNKNTEHALNPHNGSNGEQRVNNNRTTALERTAAEATADLNAFYWYQIFALDSVVDVKTQTILSWHGGFLTGK